MKPKKSHTLIPTSFKKNFLKGTKQLSEDFSKSLRLSNTLTNTSGFSQSRRDKVFKL